MKNKISLKVDVYYDEKSECFRMTSKDAKLKKAPFSITINSHSQTEETLRSLFDMTDKKSLPKKIDYPKFSQHGLFHLGLDRDGNPISLPLNSNYFFIGSAGSGKTVALENLILSCKESGIDFSLISPFPSQHERIDSKNLEQVRALTEHYKNLAEARLKDGGDHQPVYLFVDILEKICIKDYNGPAVIDEIAENLSRISELSAITKVFVAGTIQTPHSNPFKPILSNGEIISFSSRLSRIFYNYKNDGDWERIPGRFNIPTREFVQGQAYLPSILPL